MSLHAPAETVPVGAYERHTCRCGAHRVTWPAQAWVSSWVADVDAAYRQLSLYAETPERQR